VFVEVFWGEERAWYPPAELTFKDLPTGRTATFLYQGPHHHVSPRPVEPFVEPPMFDADEIVVDAEVIPAELGPGDRG
jgi:hypothetical protein